MDWMWVPLAILALLYLWKRRGLLSAEQASGLMAEGAIVVDVRTPAEFDDDHVAGALSLPLDLVGRLADERLPDKEKPVLLYCLSGTRSALAGRTLKRRGYGRVHNLGSIGRARSILGAA